MALQGLSKEDHFSFDMAAVVPWVQVNLQAREGSSVGESFSFDLVELVQRVLALLEGLDAMGRFSFDLASVALEDLGVHLEQGGSSFVGKELVHVDRCTLDGQEEASYAMGCLNLLEALVQEAHYTLDVLEEVSFAED